jgi:16S rRNA (cytosine967-C5)-methyltransferase
VIRILAATIDALVAATREVLRFDRPADAVLSAFFRARPKLGRQERNFIAETVYALLRRKRLVETALAEVGVPVADPRHLALAAAVRVRELNVRELESAVEPVAAEWLERVQRAARRPLPFAIECDFPDWVIARLLPALGASSLLRLSAALNEPAPLDVRVNLTKASRDEVSRQLADEGVGAVLTPYAPQGLRLLGKPALNHHPLFTSGTIEAQDEGSQIICQLLAPLRGETVVDFCAGAGGKALALGALMRSTGRLYAFDVSARRLDRLRPRLGRSGLSNVHLQHITSERDPRVKRLYGKIDRVLVDAPCTGLGALRRNPDLKWRQTEAALAALTRKQLAILVAGAGLVKSGGRLLYATCSLLPDENESVVESFLASESQFALLPALPTLAQHRISLPPTGSEDGFLRLRPDIHATDAFFGALMERRG